MAEEPILCFDGDKAGRKAAFRAVDTALPLIGPGKSLRFALLPEGQDPDDLARAGGGAAISAVLEAARPLVEILFTREVETQPLDTPERRAGLERRLRDCAALIRDEVLKRHYLDDFRERQAALFGRNRQDGSRLPKSFSGQNWRGRRDAPVSLRTPLAPSSALAAIEPVRSAQGGAGPARSPDSRPVAEPSRLARPPRRGYRPAGIFR